MWNYQSTFPRMAEEAGRRYAIEFLWVCGILG